MAREARPRPRSRAARPPAAPEGREPAPSANAPDLDGLAALPSLGPVSAAMLVEAGVTNADALRALGAVEAWRRLRFVHGRRVTLNFLYALDNAVSGQRWSEMDGSRRAELRQLAAATDGGRR